MYGRLTLLKINAELHKRGFEEKLARMQKEGETFFTFYGGTSDQWISREVHVEHLNKLTLEEWMVKRYKLEEGK